MKIVVSKKHIATGECKVPQRCAIAAAIREADPTVSYVSVRTNGITITKRKQDGGGGVRQHWAVPIKAARAIVKFDAGEPVEPFSFSPKLVDQVTIKPVSDKQRAENAKQTKKRRAKLKKAGVPAQKYGRASRVAGV